MAKQAWDLVGERHDDDKYFKPAEHNEALKALAPELSAILGRGKPKAIADGYEGLDSRATTKNTDYKSNLDKAVVLAVFAAVLAALAGIYGGMVKDRELFDLPVDLLVIRLLVFGQIACLLLSALVIRSTDDKNKFEAWRVERAKAEHCRMTLFVAVMEEASVGQASQGAMQQSLSYTRRHLFGSQVTYMTSRAQSHEDAAKARTGRRRLLAYATMVSIVAVVAFALLSPIAMFMPAGHPLDFFKVDYGVESLIGGVGIIVAAMLAAGQAHELIHRDEENARRYRETLKALEVHGGTWEQPSASFVTAFEEAGKGLPNAARAWTQDLVGILVAEHVQWVAAKPSALRLDPIADVITRP